MNDSPLNWSDYPNFKEAEFACSEFKVCHMQPAFMATLQKIRTIYGKPLIISSGYRSLEHSREKGKIHAGEHTLGLAADILIAGAEALKLVDIAINQGVRRIGVSQKGDYNVRFLHFGIGDRFGMFPSAIWSY